MTNNQVTTDISSFSATLVILHLILFEKVFRSSWGKRKEKERGNRNLLNLKQ